MHPLNRALAAATLALLPAAATAVAQSGRIAGTVSGPAGQPLADAQVAVAGQRALGVRTGADGRFTLAGVPVGAHELRVVRIGYQSRTLPAIAVRDGEETRVEVVLQEAPASLSTVVVSASRRPERITDAPATVTKITSEEIENSVGNSYAGALKRVVGIDFIQTGMMSVAINARGFNSSFNNRMLMMEDGRIAVLPENGLPVGGLTAIPKVDLAGVEVLVGPGAALYGADASSGVLTLQTKDPREFQGTTVEASGGTRHYQDLQFRHAGLRGKLGYKVSGEWQAAKDWDNYLTYAGNVKEIGIDWDQSVARGTGALVYYDGDKRLELTSGASLFNGVGQTNVGRNQLKDWKYLNTQLKYSTPHWYFNAYRTQSLSGDSYAINRYSSAKAGDKLGLSDDSLKRLSDWPADGRLYAAEVQNNFQLPLLNDTRIVWGGQLRHDQVSSKREWLTDRETGKDIGITQRGVYAQTETPVALGVSVLLAGRYDKHDDYKAQWSPKAGLLFKPSEAQTFRVTYNRAFKSPTILQNRFDIVDFLPTIAVYGNMQGFTIKNAAGAVVGTIDPLVPEENETWEVGYKGILMQRLWVDVTAYRADYDHFFTPLLGINAAAAGTFAYQGSNTQRIQNGAGTAQTVLTYRNLGRARMNGIDAGVRYQVSPRIAALGTASVIDLKKLEVPTTIPLSASARNELSQLNAPTTKWTLGLDANGVGSRNLLGGVTFRRVNRYYFASGINTGTIPGFGTVGANVGYKLPSLGAQLNLSVDNLFTCRKLPVAGGGKADCGYGQRHLEMINMPEVGMMVFAGVRFQR